MGIVRLALGQLCHEPLRIDCDKKALAAGQHFTLLIEDLGHVGVVASVDAKFARLHTQGLIQGHGLAVLDFDFFGQRNYVAQLVHLAHGFIEDGRDDAAMTMPRRPSVALAKPEAADEAVPVFVIGKAEAHAVGIIRPAAEAMIFLQAYVARVVAVSGSLTRHKRIDCTLTQIALRSGQSRNLAGLCGQFKQEVFCDSQEFCNRDSTAGV